MKLSIIIVNYHVEKLLLECIDTVKKSVKGFNYEIIVVDNDEKKTLKKRLNKLFPEVVYIANSNKGFGEANNTGVRMARGEYLFFLNPDTKIDKNCIKDLIEFLETNSSAGVVAPVVTYPDGELHKLQGSKILTPFNSIFVLSFIHKLFPNNKVARKFWGLDWNKKKIREVDVVPGTAFIIRKTVFEEVKGFDTHFFLYFEEYDLFKRVREKGYKIFMLPSSRVLHYWGESTKKRQDINSIYRKSRRYYFKKHYGIMSSLLVEAVLAFNKSSAIVLGIIFLSIFLRFYKLHEFMMFIGDQGWFYLSARDLVLGKEFPLVGITSSHTWLHQGPLWTYMLAFALKIGNFNPYYGAYLSSFFGVLATVLIYKIGKDYVSKMFGVITALLYATSPVIVFFERMPYHTSPIPLFTLLLMYSILMARRGNVIFFYLIFFFMSCLYNLHLSTVIFWPVLLGVFILAFRRDEVWVRRVLNKKSMLLAFVALLVPMIPVLIYDSQNGFPQTVLYGGWFFYKLIGFLGIIQVDDTGNTYRAVFDFFIRRVGQLVSIQGNSFALFLILTICINAVFIVLKKKKYASFLGVVLFMTAFPVAGFFAAKTPSDAYLPMLFPGLIFFVSFLVYQIFSFSKFLGLFFTVLICLINISSLIGKDFAIDIPGSFLDMRRDVEKILKLADGDDYNLRYIGPGSQFESSTMNYEYLLWLGGNEPAKQNEENVITIDVLRNTITADR